MSEQEKNTAGLLWMFSIDAKGARLEEVEFDPSDPIYHLHKHTRNPFLVRTIAPAATKLKRSPEDLRNLFRFVEGYEGYRLAPVNNEPPYKRRTLEHPPPPPVTRPEYVTTERLSADLIRLPWMVEVFFDAVMSRLRSRPREFKKMVEELMEQLREERIHIKVYDSYRSFTDWKDFIRTLEEIVQYPSPETFDLFCSALLAYYDLAFPRSPE